MLVENYYMINVVWKQCGLVIAVAIVSLNSLFSRTGIDK